MGNQIDSIIKPGRVLYLFCDFTNPPKDKYVVISHSDSTQRVVIFVINSQINNFLKKRDSLLNCQVKIEPSDYPFLEHNSYINCADVEYFEKDKIAAQLLSDKDRDKGTLKQETKNKILKVVKDPKTITISRKYKKLITISLE